jgi:hypothetical protein
VAAEPKTRVLGEDEYPRWAALVDSSPDGSVYSLPEYIGALCRATGARFRVLAVERDGRIVGGIALYERASRFGTYIHPRRLLHYNGIVLMPHDTKYPSHSTSWNLQTLSALERSLTGARYVKLLIKNRATLTDARVFLDNGWTVEPTYTYVVDISDLSRAWARVDKNLRRLIGRCGEQGLRADTSEDFDAFFRLHEATHLRKGAGLYLPREAFRDFFSELRAKGLCRLYHARMPDGRVAASQLVLAGKHPVTHTVSAGTDPEFLNLGVSAFLRWKVFEDLAGNGYKANDLTDAGLNLVTRFKSQLGGELTLNLEFSRPDHPAVRLAALAKATARLARRAVRRVRPMEFEREH